MKKKISKTFKLNLYRKEQFILCTILLCFMLSSVALPQIKNYLYPVVLPSDSFVETVVPEADTNEMAPPLSQDEEISIETDISNSLENTENHIANFESPDQSVSSNNSPDSSFQTPVKEPEKKPENEIPDKPANEAPKEPEKEWVPPIYEIIHHEAIYETVRVVICNYCSEEFSTVGEFQVHKNTHGG